VVEWPELSIDEIVLLLEDGAQHLVEVPDVGDGGRALSHTHLEHALQTAAVLRSWVPGDDELVVAGLVHDLGQLLPGAGDARHAEAGAAAVRGALGERVAELVRLHVPAKRYLVSAEAGYGSDLAPDSVASLALQGGPMSAEERSAFETEIWAADALTLRRADESGKVEGLKVEELATWIPVLREVHAHAC
jgi:predicted HD phosphohydrolase